MFLPSPRLLCSHAAASAVTVPSHIPGNEADKDNRKPSSRHLTFRGGTSINSRGEVTAFVTAGSKGNMVHFAHRTRFLVLLLSTLCLACLLSNSLTVSSKILQTILYINFTVIYMYDFVKEESTNGTSFTFVPLFSQFEKSLLFSVLAIGNLLGVPLVVFIIQKYGILLESFKSRKPGGIPRLWAHLRNFNSCSTTGSSL